MAKKVLQSVGEESIAFDDQCYYVAENVKRFLNTHHAGEEVEVTVKDINGTPMVTFLKKAGIAPPQGQRQQYGGQPQYNPAPRQFVPQTPRPAAAPVTSAVPDGTMFLAAALIKMYSLDINEIKDIVAELKKPKPLPVQAPPVVATPPPMVPPVQMQQQPVAPVQQYQDVDPVTGLPY